MMSDRSCRIPGQSRIRDGLGERPIPAIDLEATRVEDQHQVDALGFELQIQSASFPARRGRIHTLRRSALHERELAGPGNHLGKLVARHGGLRLAPAQVVEHDLHVGIGPKAARGLFTGKSRTSQRTGGERRVVTDHLRDVRVHRTRTTRHRSERERHDEREERAYTRDHAPARGLHGTRHERDRKSATWMAISSSRIVVRRGIFRLALSNRHELRAAQVLQVLSTGGETLFRFSDGSLRSMFA
ncbi:MAG TPA: hypothetical protein VI072_35255 [Polyangiaceae bacterium]